MKDDAYICSVNIKKKFRGMGFGKQLLQKARNICQLHQKFEPSYLWLTDQVSNSSNLAVTVIFLNMMMIFLYIIKRLIES